METPNFEKRQFTSTEEAVQKFFMENEIDKLSFDTEEEAQNHVNFINKKYGDIAFVVEDRGLFSVKFKVDHLGKGFEGSEDSGLERAA